MTGWTRTAALTLAAAALAFGPTARPPEAPAAPPVPDTTPDPPAAPRPVPHGGAVVAWLGSGGALPAGVPDGAAVVAWVDGAARLVVAPGHAGSPPPPDPGGTDAEVLALAADTARSWSLAEVWVVSPGASEAALRRRRDTAALMSALDGAGITARVVEVAR